MQKFETIGFKGGIWSGLLQTDPPRDDSQQQQPYQRIALAHLGQVVALAQVQQAGPGEWRIAVAIPSETLSDGVHSYILIADDGQGHEAPLPGANRLGNLSLMAGIALDQDLQAEIALLKAEVELLKREFRRMAVGQSSAGAQ